MGMFDSIYFNCTCGEELEAQSKSGDCCLNCYPNTSVPISVAIDANRHSPYKCKCGKEWEFDESVIPKQNMHINLPIKEVVCE
jgi:hypothetical protein